MKALHSPSLGDEARAVYGVWQSTASSFLGIVVNLHKSSQQEVRPWPVPWRNPKLLNVHTLILSQPCYAMVNPACRSRQDELHATSTLIYYVSNTAPAATAMRQSLLLHRECRRADTVLPLLPRVL